MDASAAHYKVSKEPRFSIDILRSLRAEVDALLRFLWTDSETEKVKDEATISTSATKPIRRGRAPVVLPAAKMAKLVEALLLEIVAALASGELGDDQDHV